MIAHPPENPAYWHAGTKLVDNSMAQSNTSTCFARSGAIRSRDCLLLDVSMSTSSAAMSSEPLSIALSTGALVPLCGVLFTAPNHPTARSSGRFAKDKACPASLEFRSFSSIRVPELSLECPPHPVGEIGRLRRRHTVPDRDTACRRRGAICLAPGVCGTRHEIYARRCGQSRRRCCPAVRGMSTPRCRAVSGMRIPTRWAIT